MAIESTDKERNMYFTNCSETTRNLTNRVIIKNRILNPNWPLDVSLSFTKQR